MSGPRKTPTAILKLRGSWLAKTRNGEPQPESGIPECPEFLTGEAREEWARVTKEIASMCVLAVVDRAMVVAWCQAWAMLVKSTKDIETGGTTTSSEKTGEHSRPCVAHQQKAIDQLSKLAAHFGLSPSARASLTVSQPKQKNDDKSRFFNQTA